MAQPPRILWFYGDVPPQGGGETTIGDAAALFAGLAPATQDWFRENRVTYVRNLADGDWQATFMTDSLEVAERFCAENDMSMAYDAETGTLSARYSCSALRQHGGQTLFINNLLFIYLAEWAFRSGWAAKNLPGLRSPDCPMVVRTADGAPLPEAVMSDVRAASDRLTRFIRWQKGDIALIDNHRVLHGRAETDGGARSIFVRLGSPAFPLPEAA
jgi:hypothetical protein